LSTTYSLGDSITSGDPTTGLYLWRTVTLTSLGENVTNLLTLALMDIQNDPVLVHNSTNIYSQVDLVPYPSQFGNGPFCPKANASHENLNCTYVPPIIDFNNSTSAYFSNNSNSAIMNFILDLNQAITARNAIQTMLAAVRVDIGNARLQNNFIVNSSVFNVTTSGTNASQSSLFSGFDDSDFPLTADMTKPAVFDVLYQCRTTQLKSAGSVFISVLVATLSIFSSGWAGFMVIAATIAKWNKPEANSCDAPHPDSNQDRGRYSLILPELKYEEASVPASDEHGYMQV